MKTTKTTLKYAGIDLDIINSEDELVPQESLKIELPLSDKKAIAIALKNNLACLLVGETGTGKTSVVKELAHLRKQPYVRVNMTGFTTPDELIGTKSVKNGETYYELGIITDAMQRGAILVLDEINATMPDCLFILHGLLDDDRRISLPNGQIIRPHQDFRVFATCNPDYEGTKSMNKAFMDRFPIIIAVNTLAPKKEKDLLIARTGIKPELADQLITIATMNRKNYIENKISTFTSTRSLLNIAHLINQGMTPQEAYTTTIVRKTNYKEEQAVLRDSFLAVLKANASEDNDIPTIISLKELEELEKAKKRLEALEATHDKTTEEIEKELEMKAKDTEIEELKEQLEKLTKTTKTTSTSTT